MGAAFTIEEVSAAVRRFEAESKTDPTITPWAILTWLEVERVRLNAADDLLRKNMDCLKAVAVSTDPTVRDAYLKAAGWFEDCFKRLAPERWTEELRAHEAGEAPMGAFSEGALVWEPAPKPLKAPNLYFVTEVSSTEGTFLRRVGDGIERRLPPDSLPTGWRLLTYEECAKLVVGAEEHFDG